MLWRSSRRILRCSLHILILLTSVISSRGSAGAQEKAKSATEDWIPVVFVSGSAYSKEGNRLRLLDTSVWAVESPGFILVPADVVIVRSRTADSRCGILYVNAVITTACRLSGPSIEQLGYLTAVVRASRDGAVLETSDGSLWEVPNYDQYDTGYWLPPYEVIITADELYLYNLEEGRRIWVTRIR